MFDLLIQNVSVLMPDFSVKEGQNIYVKDSRIVKIADAAADDAKEAKEVISGRGKLVMPGLIDGHTHTCQQLLRGRTANEYPMVWTRILVPFESNLTPEDCYYSAKLACLEMIKSGTTAFAWEAEIFTTVTPKIRRRNPSKNRRIERWIYRMKNVSCN